MDEIVWSTKATSDLKIVKFWNSNNKSKKYSKKLIFNCPE